MTRHADNRWHPILHARFRGNASPLLVLPDTLWSAASLWAGTRAWLRALRAADVAAGDCLVCALPPGPAFVQVLLACLWDRVIFAPVATTGALPAACAQLRPRLCVSSTHDAAIGIPTWVPDATSQPPAIHAPLPRTTPPHAEPPALLLHTSGSGGAPRWIGLSTDNVLAVLDSHRHALDLTGATVLAVLPWHHAFGLVLGLLAALRDADEIVVAHTMAREHEALASFVEQHPITHVDLVPALAERWSAHPVLRRLLASARGVVGGAPVTSAVCALLRGTDFRVGYGQTEASPGLMLGAPGAFEPSTCGRPLGCEVRLGREGELEFRGANAHHGVMAAGRYLILDPERWQGTGDRVVRLTDGTWRFRERIRPSIKLANGRWVDGDALEERLRAIAGVGDAVVIPDGHGTLVVGCATRSPIVDDARLRRALGPIGTYVSAVHCLAPTSWPLTPKGTVDRGALQRLLF